MCVRAYTHTHTHITVYIPTQYTHCIITDSSPTYLHSLLILQVRFVKGDDLWLSHDYQRDSCHITQLLYKPEDAKRAFYFGQFYRNTRKFQGRPHWGKKFVSSLSDMTRIYPKMAEFLELRKEFDPKGTFVNRFLGSTFKLWRYLESIAVCCSSQVGRMCEGHWTL